MAVRKLLGRSLTGSAWSTFLCLGQSLDTRCWGYSGQAGSRDWWTILYGDARRGPSRHISSAVIRRRRKGKMRGGHHG